MERRIFTYEEAVGALPEVRRLTEVAVERVVALLDGPAEMGESDVPEELLEDYQRIVYGWVESVQGLGVEVKGLWLVDFDCGGGYYCWRHPEPGLQYFHGYDEGFQGRVLLT